MQQSARREMLKENVQRSLSKYFAANFDRLGFISVMEVILSPDARSAQVVVNSEKDRHECLEKLKSDFREINNSMRSYFKVKNLPQINFYINESENF